MTKLLLFDIDGTLTRQSGDSDSAHVLFEKYGISYDTKYNINFEGYTMYSILKRKLESCGFENPEKEERFFEALQHFQEVFRNGTSKKKIEAIEGVRELLERLRREDVILALLTGNERNYAKAKLERVDFWKYFSFGAFGGKHEHREDLVPAALKEAKKHTGKNFGAENTFIIGDTLKDISCAKAHNIPVIAVATGSVSYKTLLDAKPDYVFETYTDNIDEIVSLLAK